MNDQEAQLVEIDRAREIHVAALTAGDAKAWAGCFDASAMQMPPDQPPNAGRNRSSTGPADSSAHSARSSHLRQRRSSWPGRRVPSSTAHTRSPSCLAAAASHSGRRQVRNHLPTQGQQAMAHGVRHLEQQRPISCVGAATTGVGRMVRVIPASGRFSCGG